MYNKVSSFVLLLYDWDLSALLIVIVSAIYEFL